MSPSIFREKGYRFYFLSNEEDRIHIHVTCKDGEVKFWIEPIASLAVSHGLNPRKLNEIQKIVEEHKNEINKPPRRKRTGYYLLVHIYYAASGGE